jgi:hypothetical protein
MYVSRVTVGRNFVTGQNTEVVVIHSVAVEGLTAEVRHEKSLAKKRDG